MDVPNGNSAVVSVAGIESGGEQREQILGGPDRTRPLGSGMAAPRSPTQPSRKASFLRRPCLIVASGIKWTPVIFITSVVGWSYYAFVVQLQIFTVESTAEKSILLVVYHILLSLFSWSYYQTVFSGPARLPPSWKLSTAMLERLNGAKSEAEWKSFLELFAVEMELPVTQRSFQGAIRYCQKCTAIKPDRSHHCEVCGICILKMDHHCPWVNNCVSFTNYKFFILFLGYALIYCIFVAASTFKYFLMFWADDLKTPGSGKFHILFVFFVAVMFCISVSSLFWYHIYLILHNRSTFEQFRSPYFNGVGPDAEGWTLGKANNFREVFGYNKWLWMFPVHTAVGDGLTYPSRLHYAGRNYQSTSDLANNPNSHDDVEANMIAAAGGSVNTNAVDDSTATSRGTSRSASSANAAFAVQTQLVLEGDNRVSTKVGSPSSDMQ